MKFLKSLKKCTALTTVFCLLMSVLTFPVLEKVSADAGIMPKASNNLDVPLISRSYLSDTGDGFMRVFYDGTQICIEYYDDSFNILSQKSVDMELDMWGGFYEGSDAYYLIEGRTNVEEDDTAEVVRVIRYDTDWNRTGAASITPNSGLWGAEVRYPFDYGCVQAAEYDGYLYIVTGHEGYVDAAYNQGHQGFLMMAVNEATMEGKIIDADLWHSFAQYIDNNGADMYVLEQSEGSRYTKLSKYTADSGSASTDASIPVLEYGGSRTSAWAIPCYATVEGMALSSDNVLCLGTSIDQSDYDNYSSETSYNIYLTVTPMSDFSEEATEVKWLTDYIGDGKRFLGAKITKINNDRYMISWGERTSGSEDETASDLNDLLSGRTLHYLFIDGDGNKLSEEFTVKAAMSDCQPVVKDSKVVFYSSNYNMVDFYSIDAETGEFSKKVYRIVGENAQWELNDGTLTISGSGALESSGSYFSSGWTAIKDNVEKIVIESGITSISESQFAYLPNLKEVLIEDGLESIGKQAFSNCGKLSKITIPASVTEIGDDILWTGYYWVDDNSHVVYASIYAPAGSYAEKYANDNGIRFFADNPLVSGDANSDGTLNVRDAAFIAQKLAMGCANELPESADFNGDGVINIRDAAAIAKYISKSLAERAGGNKIERDSSSSGSITIGKASGRPGETVSLPVAVSCNNNLESLAALIEWKDKHLTSDGAVMAIGVSGSSDAGEGYCSVVSYGSEAIPDGDIANIDFTIPEDAEAGTVYDIYFSDIDTFAEFDGADYKDEVTAAGGTITVVAEEIPEVTTVITEEPSVTTMTTVAAPVTTSQKVTITDIEITTAATTLQTTVSTNEPEVTSSSYVTEDTGVTTPATAVSTPLHTTVNTNIFDVKVDNGKIIIINCDEFAVNVVIPAEINDMLVSMINDYALSSESIESVTFKNPGVGITDSANTINEDAVIYGYWESTAHDYAKKYNRQFVSLDGEPQGELGDANDDGKVNVRDAAFIASMIAKGREDELPECADFNEDGKINVRDAAAIAKYLASESR